MKHPFWLFMVPLLSGCTSIDVDVGFINHREEPVDALIWINGTAVEWNATAQLEPGNWVWLDGFRGKSYAHYHVVVVVADEKAERNVQLGASTYAITIGIQEGSITIFEQHGD